MTKKLHHWLVIGASLITSTAFAARYDSYQSFAGRPLSVNVDLQYYKTDTNFESDGSRQSLPSGNSFQQYNFTPRVRWQFSDFALLGGFNVGNSESNDAAYVRKNSMLNRIDLAGEYLFMRDVWYRLFGRLSYVHGLEKIDYNGDTALTSDGDSEINPEVIVNVDFEENIYTFAKGGLILRGEGLSTLGTYGIGSEWRSPDYGFGAALLGQVSLKQDSHTDDANYRNDLNNRVNAGSKIFNSINPNSHQLELNFNFRMGYASLFKVYAGSALMGSNTSTGYYLGLNINWVLDYEPDFSRRSEPAPTPVFKENTNDGVNQDYFKPSQPQNQDYIRQLQGPKKNLDEATKPESEEDGMEINTKPDPKKKSDVKIKLRKDKE